MFDLKSIAYAQTEVEGTWITHEGCDLLIARLGNPAYKAYLRKIGRPHMRALQRGDLDRMDEVTRRAVARHILRDWKNLAVNGEEIRYSPEKAEELFVQYPEFFDIVVEYASDSELYREELQEDAEGN